nr:ras-related protein Rab-18 [Danaus plexippus plexippus]
MDCVTTLKILVIGESGVGKSSIILAFTTGDYNSSFPATIGVDYKCKVMEVNGLKVKLGIWDTAGQERYRTLTNSFYRDAHGAILVYDVSEPKTLQKLSEWVDELQVYSTKKNIVCLVVGNKIDKVKYIHYVIHL